jgi:hypothetical protein
MVTPAPPADACGIARSNLVNPPSRSYAELCRQRFNPNHNRRISVKSITSHVDFYGVRLYCNGYSRSGVSSKPEWSDRASCDGGNPGKPVRTEGPLPHPASLHAGLRSLSAAASEMILRLLGALPKAIA